MTPAVPPAPPVDAAAHDPGAPPGPPPAGPLSGTTVLDLSTVGPAARCTRVLADYGARVVKVGPVPSAGFEPIEPPFYAYSGGRGMHRVRLDLKDPDGRAAFLALASDADVVVESFRPGVMDRLGLGYLAVKEVNPGIVYASTSGYGQTGPRSSWAGHDLDYLGIGGFLATTGPRGDGGPPIPGASVADAAAGGLHAALAITAALVARGVSGEGTYLDVSVADGVLWLLSLAVDEHLATGGQPAPGHDVLTGRYACYDTYRAGDGRWLAVGAIEHRFFANLCTALGCGHWVDHQHDDAVQDDIRADFSAAFATRSRDEWVAELAGADTCVAPVLAVAEVADDEQFSHRGAFVEAEHPTAGRFRQVGAVLAGMPALPAPVPLPATTSTHTRDSLSEAGVDAATLSRWFERGVVA